MPDLSDEISDAILDLMLFTDRHADLPREIIDSVERLRELRRRLDESELMIDLFDPDEVHDDA